MPCHGKEDRNTILNELTCIDDTDNTDNSLKTSSDLLVDIHQKSVEQIKAVATDNKEDNNIDGIVDDVTATTGKSTVVGDDRLKLNLDDVMMGDQPMQSSDEKVDVKSVSKADKKPKKKADAEEKYLKKINRKKSEKGDSDELMLGDQPEYDEVSPPVEFTPKAVTIPPTQRPTTTAAATESVVSSTTVLSTTETRLRRETEISVNEAQSTDSSVFTTQPSVTTTAISPSVKPSNKIENKSTSKPRGADEHSSTAHHQKEVQDVHLATDHFIPPMLLVRTQFSLSNGHGEHVDGPRKHLEEHDVSTAPSNDASTHVKASPSIILATTTTTVATAESITAEATTVKGTTAEVTTATIVSITERPTVDVTTTQKSIADVKVATADVSAIKQDATTTIASTTLSHFDETTTLPTSEIQTETTNEPLIDLKKTTESTHMPITEPPRFRQPHAPKHSSEFQSKTPTTLATLETSYPTTQEFATNPPKQTDENIVTEQHSETVNTVTVTTSSPTVDAITENAVRNNCSANLDMPSGDKPIELSKRDHSATVKHHSTGGNVLHSDHNLNDHLSESIESEDPCWTEENSSADLSNSDVFQPYRPNRRRVLTKPESHSYIKKVLG